MAQMSSQLKARRRLRRKRHIRHQVRGTIERPRMTVYRSRAHCYAQIIDDETGRTLCAAGTLDKDIRGALKGSGNCDAAKAIGKAVAERALAAGIKKVVFDRNAFKYHGRVKALAEAAREAGLEF
jgi:large subunit ribosomal protein L18